MSQVVVLCGGLGTRMTSVSGPGQKCMVPVAGRPFLGHVLDRVADPPVDDILLLAGHAAAAVQEFAGTWCRPRPPSRNGTRASWAAPRTTVFVESAPAGPIGALRQAADHLDDEFLLVLGDVLPPDRAGLWLHLSRALHETGAAAVMGVATEARSRDQGNVTVRGPWVTRYDKTAAAPYIDRGIRFLRRDALARHPGDLDGPFFGSLAERGELAQWSCDEPIVEIGTPERWRAACAALAGPPVPQAPLPGRVERPS
ncbi:NTP transferase domain-containing protein [Streptomyces sp. NRRL S-340]|uniref:NTP transferase domain-containing protein n=1 Tax=Streptomyces sp. NRRL S-340 TaxID=1463901 RepID=UPI00099DEB99|nr:NTP transferase domain-containing protein [Streptomyces sp. NRRL S-340]